MDAGKGQVTMKSPKFASDCPISFPTLHLGTTAAFLIQEHEEGKGIFHLRSSDQQLFSGSYPERPPI